MKKVTFQYRNVDRWHNREVVTEVQIVGEEISVVKDRTLELIEITGPGEWHIIPLHNLVHLSCVEIEPITEE